MPLALNNQAIEGPVTLTYNVTDANTPAASLAINEPLASYGTSQPISVTSAVSQATYSAAAQTRTFTFTVTNNGEQFADRSDDENSLTSSTTPSCQSTTIAVGGSTTCTSTYATVQSDLDAGSVTATSAAVATATGGATVTSPQAYSAAVVFSTAGLHMTVAASSTGAGYSAAGQSIAFQSWSQTPAPRRCSRSTCRRSARPPRPIQCPSTSLAPAASMTCTATRVITQDDIDGRTLTTTVQAVGQNSDGVPISSDPAAVTVVGRPVPALKLAVKTASTKLVTGARIQFTLTITNVGVMTMHKPGVGIAVKHFGAPVCPVATLAPGQAAVCKLTHTVTKAEYAAKKESVAMRGTARDPSELVISSPLVRIKLAR